MLHVITDLGIGGAERLVVSAARGLPVDRFESVIGCLSARGPLAAEAEAAGVPVHCVGAWPGVTRPAAFVRLLRMVRSVRPTIVHTHLQSANLYGRLAARIARVPIVVSTEHNVYAAKARRYVAVERALARTSDALVAVSAEVQRFLSGQLGLPASRIRVIYNGVAAPKATPGNVDALRARIGAGPNVLCLATVASLTSKKGHEYLFRALADLRDRGVPCVAALAGDGVERARLDALAAQLNLQNAVHFLGNVPTPADVLAAADVFVLPSLVEGLPLALLEAMRAALPVVATAVGGVPEVVTSGVDGLLVPPGDSRALADAIASLAASPSRRSQLGGRAQEKADQRFTEEAYVQALAALYTELLAS